MSNRKMAKAIGISSVYYRLIENGYLKPGKKTIGKISEFLGEDFTPFLEGAASNPCDLPDKKSFRIVVWFYHIMSSWITRGILMFLAAASVCFFISSFVVGNYLETHYREYYDPELCFFADEVRTKGTPKVSLLNDYIIPELSETSDDPNTGQKKYVGITSHYADGSEFVFDFKGTYRTDTHRYSVTLTGGGYEAYSFYSSITVTNIETTKRTYFTFIYDENLNPECLVPSQDDSMNEIAQKCAASILPDINHLIVTKTDSTLTYPDIARLLAEHNAAVQGFAIYEFVAGMLGMLLSAVLVFAVIFALLYGRKKTQAQAFARTGFEVDEAPEPPLKPLKKDIRITPFIPETILEFVGIFLVFIGSFRCVFYVAGFFGLVSLGNSLQGQTIQEFMGTFMVGMFLLYFLDFDIFLEDRRVARNIFLYAIVFFCLYFLEISLLEIVGEGGSLIGDLSNMIIIPNMFGSISCYFMIMFFLFYTPKKLSKTYQLVLFRCLTILPIAYIAVSWILFHGNGVWFNLGWSRWGLYLFNGERLPFSILAVSYLVGYYFIRLFFEKRYGKKNAQAFFNSNRFLWIKNVYVALIICAVALTEFLLSGNPTAAKLDIGHYSNLIVLAPILLFYHPHKGPRNKAVDWTTLGLYILALVIAYVTIVVVGVIGFAMNVMD